ncbi:hypothetical protein PF005_g30824 [Phytophthora fragariae]|nr:hypothetical protein PF003_g16795 [Phytophthora fragariae]KAE8918684.1 hypothetical protein PF009_g31003 [Phytophthora fragariae]KAE8963408.1 hypothetical protein PF011_g29045 [Phytophthora fragariae]KAE9060704.1 hypothetical protein PF007_g30508 [Phytophthora fragariae]KAE9061894.1 hypothetical protein PF010_g29638 [Phytophthora fragariae]
MTKLLFVVALVLVAVAVRAVQPQGASNTILAEAKCCL